MGRLSPFKLSLGLVVVFTIFIKPNNAAPVQESAVHSYENDKGCFFMGKHYPSNQVVETNDKCLNCTCAGSALMCYLRVCPFIKPLNEHCKVEKHPEDCCPKYYCLETYPRVTTEKPEETKGCYVNGLYLDEGARIPMDPLKPCEACYCIRNTSVCTLQTCKLDIEGCKPQFKIGSCCPSRYNCTDEAATTVPPGIMEPEEYEGCRYHGILYKNGEQVSSPDKCQQCYCMKHEVVCTVRKCEAPSPSCVPLETPEGECCPDKYDCPSGTEIPESALIHMVTTEADLYRPSTTEKPQTGQLPFSSVTLSAVEDESSEEADASSTSEIETMFPTTKGVRRIDDEDAFTTIHTLEAEVSAEEVSTEVDLISRPRVPKITEAPDDDILTSSVVPKAITRRPTFYANRTVPGEGGCFYENRTYQNGEKFMPVEPCRENCTCINSVVNCDIVECILIPPKSDAKCKQKKDPGVCCPRYVCDTPESTLSPKDTVTHVQQTIVEATQEIKQQEIISDSFEFTSKSDTPSKTTELTDQQTQSVSSLITEEVSTSSESLETALVTKQQVTTTSSTTEFSSEDEAISSTISETKTTIEDEVSPQTSTTKREEITVSDETIKADVSTLKDTDIISKNITTAFTEVTPKSEISTQFAETMKPAEATTLKSEAEISTEHVEMSTISVISTSDIAKSDASEMTTMESVTVSQITVTEEKDVLTKSPLPEIAIAEEVRRTPSDSKPTTLTEATSSEASTQSVKAFDQIMTSTLSAGTETDELDIKKSESTSATDAETFGILSTTETDSFTSEKEVSTTQTSIVTKVGIDDDKEETESGTGTVADSKSTVSSLKVMTVSTVKEDLTAITSKEIDAGVTKLKDKTDTDGFLKETTLETEFTETTLLRHETTVAVPHTSRIPTTPLDFVESETPSVKKTETEEKFLSTYEGEITDKFSTKLKWTTPELSTVTSSIFPETLGTDIFEVTDDEKLEIIKTESTDADSSTIVSLIKLTTDEIKTSSQTDATEELKSQTTSALDAETSSETDEAKIVQTTKILTPESVETLPTTITTSIKETSDILTTTPKTTVSETETSAAAEKGTITTDIGEIDVSKEIISTSMKTEPSDILDVSTLMSHAVTQKLSTKLEEDDLGDKSTKSETVTVREATTASSFVEDTETSSIILDQTSLDTSTLTQDAETKLPATDFYTKDEMTAVSGIFQTGDETEKQETESTLSTKTYTHSQVDITSTTPPRTEGEGADITFDEQTLSTSGGISLLTEKTINATETTVVASVTATAKISSDIGVPSESEGVFEPSVPDTGKITDVTQLSTTSLTSTESADSEITMNTLVTTYKDKETTSKSEISTIKETESFGVISTSDELQTDSTKPSTVTTDIDKLSTKPSLSEVSHTQTEQSESTSLSSEIITSDISTISTTKETHVPSTQTISTTLHSDDTSTKDEKLSSDIESTKLDTEISTTSVTTEALIIDAGSTMAIESEIVTDLKDETLISTDTTKYMEDAVSAITTISDLLDVTTMESKDTSSERTTVTMLEESETPSTESGSTTDDIERDTEDLGTKDITTRSDLPETTEYKFSKSSTTSVKRQEQDVTTISDLKFTEITEQASSTQETEILTDNILTSVKHIPDSLIRDENITHSREPETSTMALTSEIDEVETSTKILHTESFETQEADTTTKVTTGNFSETSVTDEIQQTEVTEEDIFKIKASSGLPEITSTDVSIMTSLATQPSTTSKEYITERSTTGISESLSTTVKSKTPEDIQFGLTEDGTASELPLETETSDDKSDDYSTLAVKPQTLTTSRSTETTIEPDKHISTLFIEDSSESKAEDVEMVTDGGVATTSKPIVSTEIAKTGEFVHSTEMMDTDISTAFSLFHDKMNVSFGDTPEGISTTELQETASFEDQTQTPVAKFTSEHILDEEITKIEIAQTKDPLSSTFVTGKATTESSIGDITRDQKEAETTSLLSTTLKEEVDKIESPESTTKQDVSTPTFTTEGMKLPSITTKDDQAPLSTSTYVTETDIGIKQTDITFESLESTTESILNITDFRKADSILTHTDETKLPKIETSTLLLVGETSTLSSVVQDLEISTEVTKVSGETTTKDFTDDVTKTESTSVQTTDTGASTAVDEILGISNASVEISLTTEVQEITLLTGSTLSPMTTTGGKTLIISSLGDEIKMPSTTDREEDIISMKAETSTQTFTDLIPTKDQKFTVTKIDQLSEGTTKDSFVFTDGETITISDTKSTKIGEITKIPEISVSTEKATVTSDRITESGTILSTLPVSESETTTVAKLSEESISTRAVITQTQKPFTNDTSTMIDTKITTLELSTASDELSTPIDIFESQSTKLDADLTQQSTSLTNESEISSMDTESTFVSTELPHTSVSSFSIDDRNISTDYFSTTHEEVEIRNATTFVTEISTEDFVDIKTLSSASIPEKESSTLPDKRLVTEFSTSPHTFSETETPIYVSTLEDKIKLVTETLPTVREDTKISIDTTIASHEKETSSLVDKEFSTPIFTSVGTPEEIINMTTTMSSTIDESLETKVRTAITPEILQTLPSVEPAHEIAENETLIATSKPDISKSTVAVTEKDITISSIKQDLITESDTTGKTGEIFITSDDFKKPTLASKDQTTLSSTESVSTSKSTHGLLEVDYTVTASSEETSERIDYSEKTNFTSSVSEEISVSTKESLDIVSSTESISTHMEGLLQKTNVTDDSLVFDAEATTNIIDSSTKFEEKAESIFTSPILSAEYSTTESIQSFESTEREALTTHDPKFVATETKAPEVTELSMIKTVSTDTVKQYVSTETTTDLGITSSTESKLMDATTKGQENVTETKLVKTQDPGEDSTSITTKTIGTSTKTESSLSTVGVEESTHLPKENVSDITIHQDTEISVTPTSMETEVITSATLYLKETTMVSTERVFTEKPDKFDESEASTIDLGASKESSIPESQTTDSLMYLENATHPKTKTPVVFTSTEGKAVVTDMVTQTSDGKESAVHTTTERLKETSFTEKEDTDLTTAEMPHITDSEKQVKTDSFESDILTTTTKIPTFDITKEITTLEDIVVTEIADIHSSTQKAYQEGETGTETSDLEDKITLITDIPDRESTATEAQQMTKSPESSTTFKESTDLVTDKIYDVSKELTTTAGIQKDLTTEKVSEFSDSTIKLSKTEKIPETIYDVTKGITTSGEVTDEYKISSDIPDKTKPEITKVEYIYTTYVTEEKDISSKKDSESMTTQPISIESVQDETGKSTVSSIFTKEPPFITTEEEKVSVKDSSSIFIIPTTDVHVSETLGTTDLITKDFKSTEFSTLEQFTKVSSLEPDSITKQEPTEVSESTTKIPFTERFIETETVTLPTEPTILTTESKIIASVTTKVSAENITEHETQTSTTVDVETSKRLSTEKLDTLEDTKTAKPEMYTETSVSSDEILTTLPEISKTQTTTILPRKTTIIDANTTVSEQITVITSIGDEDKSLLTSIDFQTSTETVSPEKLSDSQTTLKVTTEVIPKAESSPELPMTFSSELDTTTSIISKKESEISTFEPEITTDAITEHRVITEETILSNATFAAGAMVVTTSPTSVSTDDEVTSTTYQHSITDISSPSSSLITKQFETSIMDSGTSQDITPESIISTSDKLETTLSSSHPTKRDEAVYQTTSKTTKTETFVSTESIAITQEYETTEVQEEISKHIPTKFSTQFTTETPIITSETVVKAFGITKPEPTDMKLTGTGHDLVETGETEDVSELKGKYTTDDIETEEELSSKTTEYIFISSTTKDNKTVSSTVSGKEAETASPTFSPSTETSSLIVKTSTVEKEDEITFTDTTQSEKSSPEKVTSATEIMHVVTTESAITTEKRHETTSQDSFTSKISEDEKIFTSSPRETSTTIQPSDTSEEIAASEMTQAFVSSRVEDSISTEETTHLSTEVPEIYSTPSFMDKPETLIPLTIATTEKSDSQTTDKVHRVFEGTTSKMEIFSTERPTEIAISEIVTQQTVFTTDFDISSKDMNRTDTPSQTVAETDSTTSFDTQSIDKLSTVQLIGDLVTEKEDLVTTKLSENITTEAQPSIETDSPFDLQPSSDKDVEKGFPTTFVATTEKHLVSTTEKTSSTVDTKLTSTTRLSSQVTGIEDGKLDSILTTEILKQETSSEMTSSEKPSVTESTSSTATTISSDIVTGVGTLQFGLTTDSIPKEYAASVTVTTDDKISTETTTLEKTDDCFVNGTFYKDAQAIITIDPCEKCHCSSGEIVCFKILCKLPNEGCNATAKLSSECCPSSYECPEEEIETTTSRREFTVKDVTTPIPISFMFSTMPSSIASTVLVTKHGEPEELTEISTESATKKELQTISDKDVLFTVSEIELTDEAIKEVSSTDTLLEEIETRYPGTEVTHLTTKISTSTDLDAISTTDSPATDIKWVQTQSEMEDTIFVTAETLTSLDHDVISTFKEAEDITSSEKTLFHSSTEHDDTLETKHASTIKDYITTTSKDESMPEITKQPTETPTTLHTIKTAFTVTHVDKDVESSLTPGSTTGISVEADVKELTPVQQLTTSSVKDFDTESTTVSDTEKTKLFATTESTKMETSKEYKSTATTDIGLTKDSTTIASTYIKGTKEFVPTETTDIVTIKETASSASTDIETVKEFYSTEIMDIDKTKHLTSAEADIVKIKEVTSTASTDIEKTKDFDSTEITDTDRTKEFTSTETTDIVTIKEVASTASTDIEKTKVFDSTEITDIDRTIEFTSTETTDIATVKEITSTVSPDIEKMKDFKTTETTDIDRTKEFTSTATSDIEITKDLTSIASTDIEKTKDFGSTEITDTDRTKEFTSTETTDIVTIKEVASTASTDIEKTKVFDSTEITDIDRTIEFTSTETTDIATVKEITSTVSPDIEKMKDFKTTETTDIDRTKEFTSTATSDIEITKDLTSIASTDIEKTKDFGSTEITDTDRTKEFTSTETTDIVTIKEVASTASTDIEKTKVFDSTEISDIDRTIEFTSTETADIVTVKEITSTVSPDIEKMKDFKTTETTDVDRTKEFTSTATSDIEITKDLTSIASTDIEKTKDFGSTEITDTDRTKEFTSTETTDIVTIKEVASTASTDIEKTKVFDSTETTDIDSTKEFTSTATFGIEKTKDLTPTAFAEFTSTETTDIVTFKDQTSVLSIDIDKEKEFTSRATTDIEQTKESTSIASTDTEITKEVIPTKTTSIEITKDSTSILSTHIEKTEDLTSTAAAYTEKESILTSATESKTMESTPQATIQKEDSVSTMPTIVKEDSTKTSGIEDSTNTTIIEDTTEQVTTLIPSKLPKLDAVTTVSIETSPKATVSIERDEVTMAAETTTYEISTKEITRSEITAKETKLMEKEIVTTDLLVRTTLLPETSPSSVSSLSDSDEETSSQKVEFTTDKHFNETTEETEFLSNLSSLPTLPSKLTSLDMVTSTDKTVLTETTESSLITSTFKSKDEAVTSERVHEITKMETGEKFDKDHTEISATPLKSTTSSDTDMTTDYEIVTEIIEQNKTITSLDREGTVLSLEKELGTPTIPTSDAILIDTSSLPTTVSQLEENETTLFTGVTDKIFTFVSTRFTDFMKGITELTTAKPHNETESISIEDLTTIPTLAFSTEEIDESAAPFIPGKFDNESSTTEDESFQKAKTAQSTVLKPSTQKSVTKLMSEETSETEFESGDTTKIDVTTETETTSYGILTKLVSIMTSPEPETILLTTESDKGTTSTAESTEKLLDISLPDRSEEAITTSKSTQEPEDDQSTDKSAITSSIEEQEISRTVSETTISETAKTKLPTLSPDAISDMMVDKISSTQEETSETTQESRIDTILQHSTMASATEDRDIISDTSSVTFTKSPSTTSATKALSDLTESVSESESPVTIETSEKQKEFTLSDTDKPSRATRKDMGLESTPATFTKVRMDSTIEELTKETQSISDISHEINETISTYLLEETTISLDSESTTKKIELPLSLDIANVTDKHTTVEEVENDTSTTFETRTDSPTSSEAATKFTKDIPVVTTMTRDESVTDVARDITTSSVDKEISTASELTKIASDSAEFTTVTEKELSTSKTTVTKSDTIPEDLRSQEVTPVPIGTITVLHAETTSTSSTEKSTASVTTDTSLSTMPITERATTVEDLETQKTTIVPLRAETERASSTEKSTVAITTDTSSSTMLVTERGTTVEDLETEKTTIVPLRAETETASSTEKSTASVTTDTSSSTMLITERGTTVEDLEKQKTTIVPLRAETETASSTEKSTASVTTETSSSTMLITERGTTVEDLETQKTTIVPLREETERASSTEKSTVAVTTDTSSSPMLVTERGTKVEDFETQKTTIVPLRAETETDSSTEKSTISKATDTSSISTFVTENGTVVGDFGTQMTSDEGNITVVLSSETTTSSSTEKSTASVTTDTASSPTLATRKEAKDNATEIITKGFKAIVTTPLPYTTTHPSVIDVETTAPEDDYLVDENTCIFQGRLFQSAEQIPRVDPCEFCFCFRGDIICLQQSCPPPARSCNETRIAGFCCPRYECPVYLATRNMTLFNRRKGAQEVYIQQKRIDKREIKQTIEVKGCQVNGTFYELGKTVTSASGPCLHCECQEDGLMHCDPQRCKPQPPLMLKMNNSFFRRR